MQINSVGRLTSNNTRIGWTCWQSWLHRPLQCCARRKTRKHRLTHSQEREDDTRTYRARYRSTHKNCRKKRSSSRLLRFRLTRDVYRTTYSLSTELTDIPISSHWSHVSLSCKTILQPGAVVTTSRPPWSTANLVGPLSPAPTLEFPNTHGQQRQSCPFLQNLRASRE